MFTPNVHWHSFVRQHFTWGKLYDIPFEQREERKGTTRDLFQCILEAKMRKLEKHWPDITTYSVSGQRH